MKNNNYGLDSLILIEQVAYSVAVPILLCVFLGRYADERLNSKGLFTVILAVLGCLTALYNIYKLSDQKSNRK